VTPFQQAWDELLGIERGYSNHPHDPGGPTMYGVTERVARAYGYLGDMRYLPIRKAVHIARAEFWDPMRLDDVARRSTALAGELLDTAYNMGSAQAGEYLQRALNAFGRVALVVDGRVGQLTIDALYAFLLKRGTLGETVMLRVLNAQQCCGYMQIVAKRPASASFFFGWVANRVR
jgi:lysozyme family protein